MKPHLYSRMNEKPEFLSEVRREIADLPQDDRKILALASARRSTYREISTLLTVSVETVQKKIAGAREKLRTRLFAERVEPDRAEFLEAPNRSD
jgi:RNA polymerase sigma factor (sigma-70 family)